MSDSGMQQNCLSLNTFDTSDIFRTDSNSTDVSLRELEERMNNKMAMGMKKALHFIVDKYDFLFESRIKTMVKDEVDLRIKEMFRSNSNSKTFDTTDTSKSRRKRQDRMAHSSDKKAGLSKIPRIAARKGSGFTPTWSGSKFNNSE